MFCVDNRSLHSVKERDSYPIPRMAACIALLGKPKMFLTLDASTGYCQTGMDDKDVDETAFDPYNVLFKNTRMQFKLKNALATFQCAMDVKLFSVK